MAIANVVQRGTTIFVYDEKNRPLCNLFSGTGPNDGLKGYTGSSVNIRRGDTIFTYNEKGAPTGQTSAR